MNRLYSNIGGKVKIVAGICGLLGIVCIVFSLLVELITLFDRFNGMFLLTCGILGLLCLVSSWPLYAFGQLVDDVHQMKENSTQQKVTMDTDELPEL